jgi:hypothetical protein
MTKHEVKTAELARKLGFNPDVHFVELTTRGAVSFTCGKPEEIQSLLRATLAAGMTPSKNLVAAARR